MDLLIIIGILIIPLMAHTYLTSNYNKYKKVVIYKNLTGFEVARKILDDNGLEKINVIETKGKLSDHYDPSKKVVRLSNEIYNSKTIVSMSIAAHECGHAIQDKEGYFYMRFRSFIFPIVKVATSISYFIILLGFLAELTNLIYLGIGLVSLGLLFQLITLPVEFDASKKAKVELSRLNLIIKEEKKGSSKVLTAAAMTYVAGVLTSTLELVRLVLIANNQNRK